MVELRQGKSFPYLHDDNVAKHARKRHLVIMAKFPRAGCVKTRLAADLGEARAVAFYRQNLQYLVRMLGKPVHPWQLWLAITPRYLADSGYWKQFRDAGSRVHLIGQGTGGLGERMEHVFATLPGGPALMIGSDVPDIPPSAIYNAFARLRGQDAVFGPSGDGGYWLLGMSRILQRAPDLHGVRWSGKHALADSLACFEGKRVSLVEAREDIDDIDDYHAWRAGL